MFIKSKLLEQGWGPGGWQFHQPETNWHAPFPLANNFKTQVENIQKHREANPRFQFSTDPAVIAKELEEYTLARWRKTYSEHAMQKFLEHPDVKKKPNAPSFTKSSPRSLLGRIAERAGIEDDTLVDWFGAGGKPVTADLSASRAAVCKDCPGNRKGMWRDALTIAGAKALRVYFGAKNEMRLSTPFDKDLGLCKACGCVLELKVHVPDKHVVENLREGDREKLREQNAECWILKSFSEAVVDAVFTPLA